MALHLNRSCTVNVFIAVIASAGIAFAAPTSDQPLSGEIHKIFALADGKAVLLTSSALYVSDDRTLIHWVAKASLPNSKTINDILGGSSDRIYLGYNEIDPKVSTGRRLMAWSPEAGFEAIPLIPKTGAEAAPILVRRELCSFVDAKIGFYAEGQGLIITTDGGKTWLARQDTFEKMDYIAISKWISAELILSCDRMGNLILSRMDHEGHLTKVWTTKIVGPTKDAVEIVDFGVDAQKRVWALTKSKTLHVLQLADGKSIAEADILKIGTSIIIWGESAFIATEDGICLWQLIDQKLVMNGSNAAITWIESAASLPGNAYVVSAGVGEQMGLVRLNSDLTKMPSPIKIRADNQAIPQDASRPADLATPEELNSMLALAKQLSPAEQSKILAPILAQGGLSNRERVRLATLALQKIINEKSSTTQPK